jgi:hypothetical protein
MPISFCAAGEALYRLAIDPNPTIARPAFQTLLVTLLVNVYQSLSARRRGGAVLPGHRPQPYPTLASTAFPDLACSESNNMTNVINI